MFIFLFLSALIFSISNLPADGNQQEAKEVKGAETSNIKVITPNPTVSTAMTPTPTISKKTKIIPSSSAKQLGGWYWREDLGRSERWMGTDSQGKDIWTDMVNDPQNTESSNNNSSVVSRSEKIIENISTTTYGIVLGNSVPSQPVPSNQPFEASWTVDNSNGSAKITANKQLKECEGKETNPISTGGGYEVKTALKSLRGNICELFFSPPNTPNYDWLDGARVVSVDKEEKNFGNW